MTGIALATLGTFCEGSAVARSEQWLTIRDIARAAGISKSTAERCFKAGWLPAADKDVKLARGGTAQRLWRKSTVTAFIERVLRAKSDGRALVEVLGESSESLEDST